MLAAATPASAQFVDLPAPFITGKVEFWSGIEATRNSWSSYTGLNWSPFGKIRDDGFRLRIAGGYGEYLYGARIAGEWQSVHGTAAFADALAGYQLGLGALTVKAFAGATFDGHLLQPFDEANRVGGAARGGKAVLEMWLDISPNVWAQLDLVYSTAHATYFSRARLGYRLTNLISLGVEGGGFGNAASDSGRAGGFARYDWLGGEISVSGGVSGDIAAPRNPYGTLVYLTRF